METSRIENHKRVARNTLMLYFRMLLIMCVTLFTFRELLKVLGVHDYGVYNAVGGVVILFSFLSNAMTTSTQRYLSYGLGKQDIPWLRRVFASCMQLHALLALGIIVLAETIGLWFLNTQMDFGGCDMGTVHIVYQFTILSFAIQLMQVPFVSVIISYEKMQFYAALSIVDVLLKLSVVMALYLFPAGRLAAYAMLLCAMQLTICITYGVFCFRKFEICRFSRRVEKPLLRELGNFSGWNMLGGMGNVAANQGLNMMFNIFCGVAVNAAMGISNQVMTAVSQFFSNFQTAFNPQIIKSYASGKKQEFIDMLFRASRISFFLAFSVSLPVIVCAKPLVDLWIAEVPRYTIQFVQWSVAFCIIDALSGPLWISAQASGRIKGYMIMVSSMILSNLPAAWIMLHFGLSPVWVIGYRTCMNLTIHFARIVWLRRLIEFPGLLYLKQVMLPATCVVLLSIPLPLAAHLLMGTSMAEHAVQFFGSFVLAVVLGWRIILTAGERHFICEKVRERLHLSHNPKPESNG